MDRLKLATLAQSRCLTHEPDQGILVGHKISLQDGHVARGQAVHRHTLEPQALQKAVAARIQWELPALKDEAAGVRARLQALHSGPIRPTLLNAGVDTPGTQLQLL